MTRMKAKTRIEVFRWACFNAIIGNGDAHLKNLSFFIRKNFISMTPHYDLLSTAIYEVTSKHLEHELAQEMGEAQFLSDLTFPHVLTFAGELGLPEKLAKTVVTKLITQIVPASMALIEYVASQPTASKPGELRMLREIHFNCILEMTKRMVPK
ncbi:MAG: serine/threonine-protein kinase HipA [Paraglaciecola sp.]|jgi:serine/threonine-protein kinase HipA